MRFTKMHGAGNDYIYVNCMQGQPADPAALAVRLSDRHKGVGADGLVLICKSEVADAKMRMFNADGSEGKMCGNAIRCVGKYLYERGIAEKTDLAVETLSGVKQLRLYTEGGKVTRVRVDMGQAVFDPARIPVALPGSAVVGERVHIAGGVHTITCVSMGNPHCVVFEDPDEIDLAKLGPLFENDPLFPERVNTEFVKVIGHNRLKMRVWERGSGETMACGTGACAAVAAAVARGMFAKGQDVTVQLRGGELVINVGETVFLTGEAVTVFEGEV